VLAGYLLKSVDRTLEDEKRHISTFPGVRFRSLSTSLLLIGDELFELCRALA
jgi:hypothetical protein